MPLKMQIADSYDKPAWRNWLEELPEADDRFSNDGLIQSGRNQLYRCRFDDVDLVVKCFPMAARGRRSSIASFRVKRSGLISTLNA